MNFLAEIEVFLNISQKKFILTIDIFKKNGIMCISGFIYGHTAPSKASAEVYVTHHTDPEKDKSLVSASHIGLLLLAKEGDGDAFARLAEEYKPMLDAALAPHKAELNDQDYDDLSQEALLAFHRAVQSYEPLYGNVSFGLYAKICVNKAIISAFRQFKKSSNIVLVPLDEIEPHELSGDDPAEAVIEQERASELRAFIRENLSKYENSVWWMYYSGMSIDEIAESLNTTKKSVSNAIARIRRKLRALLS